jgi:streptomycin 6-kinase
LLISKRLKQFCAGTPQRQQWLQELPGVVDRLVTDWSISLDRVFESSDSHCSFVASAIRSNQHHVVLKIGVPHFEGEQEIAGLLFWDGEPTVYLLEADASVNAMLLERCVPGTTLKTLPATDQDHVMADMLTRLWRRPEGSHSFRHITEMVRYWREETLLNQAAWPDQDLVEHGLQVLDEMAQPSGRDVLLATDLHAGNVLRSQRKPWLAIDPKPFIGDPAYDATQHLFNRGIQTHARPKDLISDLAGLLGIAAHRIQSWMFARAAAEPRDLWFADAVALARRLSP